MSKEKSIAAERKERWGNPENFTFVSGEKIQQAKVSNADRYPDAEWLEVVKPIGSVGGSTMFLVGWEVPNSNEYPLVAVDRGGVLWATPLWELQGHSQDKIIITEAL